MNSNWYKLRERIKDVVKERQPDLCLLVDIDKAFIDFIKDPANKCDHKKELECSYKENKKLSNEVDDLRVKCSNSMREAFIWKDKSVELEKEIEITRLRNNRAWVQMQEENESLKQKLEYTRKSATPIWPYTLQVRDENLALKLENEQLKEELQNIKSTWSPLVLSCRGCHDMRANNDNLRNANEFIKSERDKADNELIRVNCENAHYIRLLQQIHSDTKGAINV